MWSLHAEQERCQNKRITEDFINAYVKDNSTNVEPSNSRH